ncbi:MAG: signal peptidase I [Myxococcota bacterium]|nr:signal peptidase I [Myxococcota bacterium]
MKNKEEKAPKKKGRIKRKKSVFREYAEAIIVALAVALLLRFFVIEAFKIPSGSMVETLAIGDFIFVNKLSYRTEIPYTALSIKVPGGGTTLVEWDQPDRGDVVVFRFPNDPTIDYIKRIVALPGDQVELRRGVLYVNGQEHERRFVREYGYKSQTCIPEEAKLYVESNGEIEYSVLARVGVQSGENFGPVTIRPGHFFAMGDNRDNSSDSRVFGQAPIENIKGRAMFVWLSLDNCNSWFGKIRWSRFFQGVH